MNRPSGEVSRLRRWDNSLAARPGLWSTVALAGWLGLWALISLMELVNSEFVTPPWVVVEVFFRLAEDGYAGSSLWEHIWSSVMRTLVGFVIAALVAIPTGLLMGMSALMFAVVNPIVAVLRPIPTIAFIPLVILWFGIGETAKIAVIFLAGFLFIVLNTHQGVLQIPRGYRRVAENLGATPRQLFFRVILPASAPSIMTGLRTGLALSWTVVVAAELVAAQKGLGYLITDGATFFRIPVVYVGIALVGCVGFVLDSLVAHMGNKLVHWRGT